MMQAYLSPAWTVGGPSLANHLWQSTVLAGVIGLLTLSLRRNHAATRYWLWLAASMKFLIPFSCLIDIGTQLGKSKAIAQPGVAMVVEGISQPFAVVRSAYAPTAASTGFSSVANVLPALLLVVWLCGCAIVLFSWCMRWRRVTTAVREAQQSTDGRELEALRRLEGSMGIKRQIELALSRSALEPSVFGILRPVLLWPAGISGRLTDAQLEAIIAHELCHVGRYDNLAAMIHMLVETIFWFHPLVWWIGARLVDERERACDETVLQMGSEPQAYAEGILKVCEFYLESPLVCMAGVTSSNLKKRIEGIMTGSIARKLDLGRKLLLATMTVAAVAGPVAIGFLNPTPSRAQSQPEAAASPVFEDISIKRSKPVDGTFEAQRVARQTTMMIHEAGSPDWTATNVTLKELIRNAYGLSEFQISGGPDWLTSERYDLHAKVEDPANAQIKLKLQALLADRFKLKFHRETKDLPVYELAVGKNGPKLNGVVSGDLLPHMSRISMTSGHRHLDAKQIGIEQLAGFLSNSTGHLVVDKTGLKGVYDVTLDWTPGDSQSLLTAVQEQLGLELNAQTEPVETLVIDQAEKPAEDRTQSEAPSQGKDAAGPAFAVVSIKPSNSGQQGWWTHFYADGRFIARNTNLKALILTAHDVQLISIPDALTSERYDIDAKAAAPAEEGQLKMMLRTLLSNRFKLTFHIATKELPVYVLVMGTEGPKLHAVETADEKCEVTIKAPGGEARLFGKGTTSCLASTLTYLSQTDPPSVDRPVLDNTGLKGVFDFDIPVDLTGSSSSFFAAVQRLGLKLETNTGPIEFLVIDHAQKPSEN